MERTWFQRVAGLALAAIVLGVAMDLVERGNRAGIEVAREGEVVDILAPYLPPRAESDQVTVRVVDAPESLGPRPVTVLLSTHHGEPAGLVFWLTDVRGYGGPIELALGIAPHGDVTGIAVLAHEETPGFGDVIDGGWLEVLVGASLNSPPAEQWKLRSQGGYFDGVSGATITLRGVIDGVRSALEYHERNKAYLYDG